MEIPEDPFPEIQIDPKSKYTDHQGGKDANDRPEETEELVETGSHFQSQTINCHINFGIGRFNFLHPTFEGCATFAASHSWRTSSEATESEAVSLVAEVHVADATEEVQVPCVIRAVLCTAPVGAVRTPVAQRTIAEVEVAGGMHLQP